MITINPESRFHTFYVFLIDFYKFKNDEYPTSLCSYFWNYLFVLIKSFFATAFLMIVASMLLSPISLFFIDNKLGWGVLSAYGIILGFGLIMILYEFLKYKSDTSEAFSLIKKFVSAKKNSFCPKVVYYEKK